MKNLLKLVKLSLAVKLNMWKCRSFNKATDEYRIAKQYQNALDNLENNEQVVTNLILETKKLQNKFHDRKELSNLLTSVLLFLNHLKLIRNY